MMLRVPEAERHTRCELRLVGVEDTQTRAGGDVDQVVDDEECQHALDGIEEEEAGVEGPGLTALPVEVHLIEILDNRGPGRR